MDWIYKKFTCFGHQANIAMCGFSYKVILHQFWAIDIRYYVIIINKNKTPGSAAGVAENAKRFSTRNFVPFGVEGLGLWGSSARDRVKSISNKLFEFWSKGWAWFSSREFRTIQRGNADSLLGRFNMDKVF